LFHNGKIFIRNIKIKNKPDKLISIFKNFGKVKFTKIINKSKLENFIKFLIIDFSLLEQSVKSAACLDGRIFLKKNLHIISSYKICGKHRDKNDNNFQKFKKIISKNKTIFNEPWFSFFISKITIKETLFKKLKNNHKDLNLDYLKINSRKKILSEGKLQNEIFLILRKKGLNISTFNPSLIGYKSKKTILIKNIIYEKEINLILKNFGKIEKYITLPFVKIIIIRFVEKKKAKEAYDFFKHLENQKKKISITWAPINCFCNFKENAKFEYKNSIHFKPKKNNTKLTNMYEKNNKNYKILIRNLPFRMNLLKFKKLLSYYCKIRYIRIPRKKNNETRGFAFIGFDSLKDMKKAFILIQNIHVQKRHLACCILKS